MKVNQCQRCSKKRVIVAEVVAEERDVPGIFVCFQCSVEALKLHPKLVVIPLESLAAI